MSVPIMLTIGMYYAVGHWNTYMAAVLYITDSSLQPVQVFLRRLLMQSAQSELSADNVIPTECLRMAAVCCSTLPIVVVYPFIQKYFVKGTLAGAVKG
jgi:putative aldouronate transport system permease protein